MRVQLPVSGPCTDAVGYTEGFGVPGPELGLCARLDSLSVTSSLTCKKMSCSWCQRKELGVVELSDLDSGGHHAPAETGGSPSARVGVLGDQSVGMEAMQDAADFSTLAFGIAALPGKVRGGL